MASRTRRARVTLGVIALAVIVLGVWRGEELWEWATTKRVYWEGQQFGAPILIESSAVRGWYYESRWSDSNSVIPGVISWYVESGLKAWETVPDGDTGLVTVWKLDGTVSYQGIIGARRSSKRFPPWLWGVTDQTEPSMPEWMKDEEKWAKALEQSKTAPYGDPVRRARPR